MDGGAGATLQTLFSDARGAEATLARVLSPNADGDAVRKLRGLGCRAVLASVAEALLRR